MSGERGRHYRVASRMARVTLNARPSRRVCRALANREIRSDHIRTPWQRIRDLDVEHPAGYLAYCTGVALVHSGYADIARPFFGWYRTRRRRLEHPMNHAIRECVPEAASLIEAAESENAPIDRIIDAAMDAADTLDAAHQRRPDAVDAPRSLT